MVNLKTQKLLVSFLLVLCLLSFLPLLIEAVTVNFSTVLFANVATCPLSETSFVVAYLDDTNDDVSFQIYDTNGTQIVAETDVDTTDTGIGQRTYVSVSAFNDTCFVIGWFDYDDQDITFSVYNSTGSKLTGPIDADTAVYSASNAVSVSTFNSTCFVIGWINDYPDYICEFAVYNSGGTKLSGPTTADNYIGEVSKNVWVSTFNSTHFVIVWHDDGDQDATFSIYDSSSTLIAGPIDVDATALQSSVCVSTFNSTHFVIGWSSSGNNVSCAVYDSAGTLRTALMTPDTAIGFVDGVQVKVAAQNSTVFVVTWHDAVDYDLTFASYWSNGTAITAATDIESWPAAENVVFTAQAPTRQETAVGINLYNSNWIIAYANTTTEAIWQAFTPEGAVWDGTIPQQGGPTSLTFNGEIPLSFGLSSLGGTWAFNRYGSITATFTVQGLKTISFIKESVFLLTFSIDGLMTYTSGTILNLFGIIPISFQLDSVRTYLFNRYGVISFHFPFTTSTSLPIAIVLNLALVLGGFAVVMVFVCLALVLDVKGKKRETETRVIVKHESLAYILLDYECQ